MGVWERPLGRLNTAASRLCEEIVPPPHEIGIRVRAGRGEDEGKFALEVVPWRRHDPLAVLLQPRAESYNTYFHATALVRLRERGRSQLRRVGNLLVGALEEVPVWTPRERRVMAETVTTGNLPMSDAEDTALADRLSTTIDLLAHIEGPKYE